MSIFEDMSESISETPLLWVAIGVAALASPKIISAGRPLIKGALKGAIALTEKTREVYAESKERLQDVYAEAKFEHDTQIAQPEAETAHAAPAPAPMKVAKKEA